MPLRVKNIAAGFYDSKGVFHPIRASADYDYDRASEIKPDSSPYSAKERKAMAEYAASVARESRKKRRKAAKKATKKTARKRAAKKTARKKTTPENAQTVSAAAAKKAVRKKTNPIPTNRYVKAKVRRTRSGDIKVILPLR